MVQSIVCEKLQVGHNLQVNRPWLGRGSGLGAGVGAAGVSWCFGREDISDMLKQQTTWFHLCEKLFEIEI